MKPRGAEADHEGCGAGSTEVAQHRGGSGQEDLGLFHRSQAQDVLAGQGLPGTAQV